MVIDVIVDIVVYVLLINPSCDLVYLLQNTICKNILYYFTNTEQNSISFLLEKVFGFPNKELSAFLLNP